MSRGQSLFAAKKIRIIDVAVKALSNVLLYLIIDSISVIVWLWRVFNGFLLFLNLRLILFVASRRDLIDNHSVYLNLLRNIMLCQYSWMSLDRGIYLVLSHFISSKKLFCKRSVLSRFIVNRASLRCNCELCDSFLCVETFISWLLIRKLRWTMWLLQSLPLSIQSGNQVHQSKSWGYAFNLFFVAAVAFSNNVAIEFKGAIKTHPIVVNKFLLNKVKFSEALIAILRHSRQKRNFIFVRSTYLWQISAHL